MKKVILTTTTCDNKYLDVMKVYLYTMNLYCPEKTLIRADLINGTPEIYKRLGRLYDNLEVCHVEMGEGLDWTQEDNMIHLMRRRIPVMWKTLNEDWDMVMTMDSDMIVRSDISEIWGDVEPSTIKIWVKPEKKATSFTKVQAGVHIFGNSPVIKEYYKAFMDRLGDNWMFRKGQPMIYLTWLDFKERIRIVQMPKKYNDSKFHNDSVVWHCKHGHFNEEKFQREFQRNLVKADEIYGR